MGHDTQSIHGPHSGYPHGGSSNDYGVGGYRNPFTPTLPPRARTAGTAGMGPAGGSLINPIYRSHSEPFYPHNLLQDPVGTVATVNVGQSLDRYPAQNVSLNLGAAPSMMGGNEYAMGMSMAGNMAPNMAPNSMARTGSYSDYRADREGTDSMSQIEEVMQQIDADLDELDRSPDIIESINRATLSATRRLDAAGIDENGDDFIFHLPAGMVDFSESFSEVASGPQTEEKGNPMDSELNDSIVKSVWATTTRNDNPYSIQNFNASSYRRHHEISPPPNHEISGLKVTSPNQHADLYFMQNLQMLEPQTLSPPMAMSATPTDGQPPAKEAALDQIQSLMRETKFVDDESYYTKLSEKGQKEALHDIIGDGAAAKSDGAGNGKESADGRGKGKGSGDGEGNVGGNANGNGKDKGNGNGNGNGNEEEDVEKDIQRGPRFKHYGHDRTVLAPRPPTPPRKQ